VRLLGQLANCHFPQRWRSRPLQICEDAKLPKMDNPTHLNVSPNCWRCFRPLRLRHPIDHNTFLAIEAPL
jgi:hypothetical protein